MYILPHYNRNKEIFTSDLNRVAKMKGEKTMECTLTIYGKKSEIKVRKDVSNRGH